MSFIIKVVVLTNRLMKQKGYCTSMFVCHAGLRMANLTLTHKLNVARMQKRVTLDMTLGSSHVHKVRTVLNSQYSHKDLVALSGWSKAYTKQKFESAMATFKVRDHRSYAQVLLSKHHNGHKSGTGRTTAHHRALQGDQNALK